MVTESTEKKTFGEIAELWLARKKGLLKDSSYQIYETYLRIHILPSFGGTGSLSENELQSFVKDKAEEGLSNKSIKDIVAVIKTVLKFGVKYGMCDFFQADIEYPPEKKKDCPVMSVANQKKVMEYVKRNLSFRNLGVYICLCTGMRIGEICALKFSDVDVKEGVIHISRTLQRIRVQGKDAKTALIAGNPKTMNSERDIPMGKELYSLLKPLCSVLNPDVYLLTNDYEPLDPRSMRRHFEALVKKLDLPAIKFHGLRHTFATRCIESDCDYKTVSVLLGHSDIKTTLNMYVHPNLEQKKKCVDKMLCKFTTRRK